MDHLIKNIKIDIVQSKKGKYLLNINNKSLKTPDGNIIELPSMKLAKILLKDYESSFKSKPLNIVRPIKITNTAIDKIKPNNIFYINEITDNLNNDMICYFANSPVELVDLQNKEWLPLINYMESSYNIELIYTSKLFSINQKPDSLLKLKNILNEINIFKLSALYTLSQITKSIIISLALNSVNSQFKTVLPNFA